AVEELLEEHHLGALLRSFVRVLLVLLDHRLLVAGPARLQQRAFDDPCHRRGLLLGRGSGWFGRAERYTPTPSLGRAWDGRGRPVPGVSSCRCPHQNRPFPCLTADFRKTTLSGDDPQGR